MATTGLRNWSARHGEPALLALVGHELVAGAAFTVAGLPGVGAFLWAVGTGLALADMLVRVAFWLPDGHWTRRLVKPTALLAAVIAAAASGAYGVGNLLGLVGVLVLMFPPQRWGRRLAPDRAAARRSTGV
ncbi:hypothetical protein [Kutzneria buriramensis]|uniref:Uncharacterized protein n=1 Tax=Kutzneria buriramensis TaxID=1045776 RepID=A0A3E0GY54_9PSEU|nr:hypothetical protein [Kutzneria buriramensis]REH34878.1 hypothetical protein BCF44_119154 [Kutzneria buriramensis]